ncbi:2-dehydropantoate 2-reductase [Variovorax sp. PCZ-1]|uniref:2-dehydropantoate 2-reductase n=1 Tax=Variovorax sp. PCZ-1 TaxID=2835533 RepID=UPI001BCB5CA7|nr:2-dehydropantoate 2-reductase [Variovorax sp. PCZ-1]MBS7808835.1 2-dehydropantoate 2-reductase [Variovorax sp. PCZ-1]
MKIQRICIVGAGSIGGWIGTKLSRCAGVQLSVFARGATLSALQKDGLQLQMKDAQIQANVKASNDAVELGEQDLVILAVKAPAVREVAAQITPLLGKSTMLLSAMNGVPWWFFNGLGGALKDQCLQSIDADGQIAQHLKAHHIIGSVVHASCATKNPGVIQHNFGNGLIIGEPSGQDTPRVQALLALLKEAGFDATLSPQIQKDIWYKLWGNMTVNPVSAITGATTDKILGDDLLRGFISNVMLEAKAIGERIGIPIAQQPEDRHQVTLTLGAFKTSMLQDVEAGRAVELDALVSSVREIGQLCKMPTPWTDALLGLARVHARRHALYPE